MLDGPFRGSAAVASGLLTPAKLRGPGFRRVFPDVYVPAGRELDLRLRSRAAYLLVGGRGALAGYSAAELLAAPCAPHGAPAEVTLPRRYHRAHPGLVVHRDTLAPDEIRHCGDVMLTGPVRTAYDLARWGDLVEAVVAIDALAGRFGFPLADLRAMRERYPRARGRRQLARAVELAEPMADSPMETRLRLLLVLRGLPAPVVQHPVVDHRAQVIAWLDLAYPAARIGIEYEGADHFERGRVIRDVHRYTRIVDIGWRVFRFTSVDVFRFADRTADRVRRALGMA